MSTTKTEISDTVKTYVTFRIIGDALDPDVVTKILRIVPTISYAKDHKYFAGTRTGQLIGRTGVWSLTTDGLVASDNLGHHLSYILGLLVPGRQDATPLVHLHALLAKQNELRADLRCFWHGRVGAKKPSIPKTVTELMKVLPAKVETDFDTDSPVEDQRKRA